MCGMVGDGLLDHLLQPCECQPRLLEFSDKQGISDSSGRNSSYPLTSSRQSTRTDLSKWTWLKASEDLEKEPPTTRFLELFNYLNTMNTQKQPQSWCWKERKTLCPGANEVRRCRFGWVGSGVGLIFRKADT